MSMKPIPLRSSARRRTASSSSPIRYSSRWSRSATSASSRMRRRLAVAGEDEQVGPPRGRGRRHRARAGGPWSRRTRPRAGRGPASRALRPRRGGAPPRRAGPSPGPAHRARGCARCRMKVGAQREGTTAVLRVRRVPGFWPSVLLENAAKVTRFRRASAPVFCRRRSATRSASRSLENARCSCPSWSRTRSSTSARTATSRCGIDTRRRRAARRGARLRPRVHVRRARRAGSDRGWGLHFVDRLSARWAIDTDGRARVWFELLTDD